MASSVEAVLESATEPALDPRGEWAPERPSLQEVHDVCRGDFLAELDRRLVALCRERGPLRAVLARIAARLVALSGWERIGYARLSDYAVERLGLPTPGASPRRSFPRRCVPWIGAPSKRERPRIQRP